MLFTLYMMHYPWLCMLAVVAMDVTVAGSYTVREKGTPWSRAVQECFKLKQQLINVKNIAQHNAILQYVSSNYNKYWIGIYQSKKGMSL